MATEKDTVQQETENKNTQQSRPKDDRVDIFIPKGYANDEPNLLISINGVNYVLPKGKTSKVPKHVAAEFERSRRAEEALDKRVSQMQEASK